MKKLLVFIIALSSFSAFTQDQTFAERLRMRGAVNHAIEVCGMQSRILNELFEELELIDSANARCIEKIQDAITFGAIQSDFDKAIDSIMENIKERRKDRTFIRRLRQRSLEINNRLIKN